MSKFDTDISNVLDFKDIEKDRDELQLYLNEFKRCSCKVNAILDKYHVLTNKLEHIAKFPNRDSKQDVDILDVMKECDKKMWLLAINTSGLDKLLTSKSLTDMREKIDKEVPVFSADYASAFVDDIVKSLPSVINGTVREVMERLTQVVFRSGNHWRGDKKKMNFKSVSKSFRFSHFGNLSSNRWYIKSEYFDIFNDMEMVCCIVNCKEKFEYPNRIGDRMGKGLTNYSQKELRYKTDWFEVQVFLNGNVKIDFTCDNTLALINKYGADGTKLSAINIFA